MGTTSDAVMGLSLVCVVCLLGYVIYNIYLKAVDLSNQQIEQHQEAVTVCNTDHLDNNMTQFCVNNNALNSTLWEIQHKQ